MYLKNRINCTNYEKTESVHSYQLDVLKLQYKLYGAVYVIEPNQEQIKSISPKVS